MPPPTEGLAKKQPHDPLADIAANHIDRYRRIMPDVVAELQKRDRARKIGQPPIPISASKLGLMFDLPGDTNETRRRRARELMLVVAIESGCMVVANNAGYFIARDTADVEEYKERLRKSGTGDLAHRARLERTPMAQAIDGQFMIPGFADKPPPPPAMMSM